MTASVPQRFVLFCAAAVLSWSNRIRWTAQAAIGDLLWSDEFDSNTTTVDTTVWNVRTGSTGWGNFELQNYTADSVRIVDGNALEIRVARTTNSTTIAVPAAAAFTSGRIDTAQKIELLYGRIEARIKTPNVVEGLWPAFWTLGSSYSKDVPWPACGEVDIMEVGQGLALAAGLGNRRVVSAAHWEYNETYATYSGSKDVDFNLNDEYNVYVLNWTPQALTTYVNGAEIWRMEIDPATCTDCEEFHQPHFIVLNVAVGGGFTTSGSNSSSSSSSAGCGSSSSSVSTSSSSSGDTDCGPVRSADDITVPLPAAMMVDWVRIFDNGNGALNYSSASAVSTRPPVTAAAAALPTPGPTSVLQADGLPPPSPPVPLFVVPTASPTRYTLIPSLPPVDSLLPPPPTVYTSTSTGSPPTRNPVTMALPTSTGNVEKSPYPVASSVADTVQDDDDNDDDHCDTGKGKSEKGKSGKSSKGDSGKSGEDKRRRRRHLKKSKKSCGEGKSKKNKSGKEFESDLAISAGAITQSTTYPWSPLEAVVTATALWLLVSWR